MRHIFSTNKSKSTVYAAPREYSSILRGSTEWYGTSMCLIRSDLADLRMKEPDYGSSLEEKVEDGQVVAGILNKVFDYGRLVAYTKKKEIRVNNQELMQWVKLVVYKGPQDLIFVDALSSPPDKLFAPPEKFTIMVDNKERDDVKVIVAPYSVGEDKYREIASSL